jgi:hypothetical protein
VSIATANELGCPLFRGGHDQIRTDIRPTTARIQLRIGLTTYWAVALTPTGSI